MIFAPHFGPWFLNKGKIVLRVRNITARKFIREKRPTS
jgi:hypothetical protein